jgi:DNA polymerase-3 subunit delta
MIHALDWLRDPAQVSTRPLYVVIGDDSYLIRESIRAVANVVLPDGDREASISRFPGATTPLATVFDEVRTLPFFSRKRLVIVDEADTFVTKHRKDLEAYVVSPSRTGTLLLQVKSWLSKTNLGDLIEEHGLAIGCSSPRESELTTWLIHVAQACHGAHLPKDAAKLLVELVGAEAGILASEIEKLAVYVGDARRIERSDILKLVGAGRVETVWKALDAATTGQARVAVELLDNLLSAGEQPVVMLAAMSANLLKIHHAGRLRAARISLDEACQMAGIPSFASAKTGKQHAHLGPSRVDRLPAMLLKADLDLKGGSSLDARAVLELLMVNLSLPRTD